MTRRELEQIPQVAVEVAKDSDRAVLGLLGLTDELDTFGGHLVIVAPEVVGAEKQKNPAAGLITDKSRLLRG